MACAYSYSEPPYHYYWVLYVVGAVAAPTVALGVSHRRVTVAVALSTITLMNYVVASAFFVENLALTLAFANFLVLGMVSTCSLLIFNKLSQLWHSESMRTEELAKASCFAQYRQRPHAASSSFANY
jgi:hypothetical protein